MFKVEDLVPVIDCRCSIQMNFLKWFYPETSQIHFPFSMKRNTNPFWVQPKAALVRSGWQPSSFPGSSNTFHICQIRPLMPRQICARTVMCRWVQYLSCFRSLLIRATSKYLKHSSAPAWRVNVDSGQVCLLTYLPRWTSWNFRKN